MKLTDFDYILPPKLIAQTPVEPRDSARLLHFNKTSKQLKDKVFSDIADMLWENDVLVVNETRVIKARLKWKIIGIEKECEIFLHTQISESCWDCLVYPGKKLKPWTKVIFNVQTAASYDPWEQVRQGVESLSRIWSNLEELRWSTVMECIIKENSDKWRIVEFNLAWDKFLDAINIVWETPLPPYIKSSDSPDERYQTVYNDNQKSWSVAAPTAGLHFTPELMKKLADRGVKIEKICLHVGLGTFLNVEVENIEEHDMHSEKIYISPEVSQRLNDYKSNWKRIIAVGTTSVRTLESFTSSQWVIGSWTKNTSIFIYPSYEWKCVDAMITNFHLPKSTLLMLVSSFIWDDNRKRVYQHAVDSQYRFFSFWDAMFLD